MQKLEFKVYTGKLPQRGWHHVDCFPGFGVYGYVGSSRSTFYINSLYQPNQNPDWLDPGTTTALHYARPLESNKNPSIMQGRVYSQKGTQRKSRLTLP